MKTRCKETAEKARHSRFHSTSQNRWPHHALASVCLAAFCLMAVTSPLSAQSGVTAVGGAAQKFPGTAVGSTSAPLTISFTFGSAGSLAANPYIVLTQGAQNLDFKAAATQASDACVTGHTYNASDVCSVNVTFTPTKPYQRIGAVQLMGSGGTPIATVYLSGTGTGPQVIFPSNSPVSGVGSGFSVNFDVAVDGNGDVFVADEENNAVKEILAVNGVVSSSSTVVTVGSGFSLPTGVAVDGSGNVFVADGDVYEIVAVNGVVSSSSSVVVVSDPYFHDFVGVAVDGSGNVFATDQANNAVEEIVAVNGVVSPSSPLVTLGSTVSNTFQQPVGIAVDGNGNVFVADPVDNYTVKEIVAVNGVMSSSSTVKIFSGGFSSPNGVAVDGSGNLYVADTGNNAVKEFVAVNGVVSPSSPLVTVASGFNAPVDLAVDASGNIFVADAYNRAVKEIDRSDPPLLSFASTPLGSTSSDSPQSILVENSGNATLAFSGLTVGANFAQASGSGTPPDCSASSSLAPDASCNLSISFTPTAIGSLSSTAVLTDNALNGNLSTQTIPLSGTGIKLTQTITFNPIPNQVQGTTLTLTATASSGLPVSYASPMPSVCSVSGASVTLLQPAACTIQASQSGNASYSAAAPVTQTFSITDFSLTMTPASQTISSGHAASYSAALKSVDGFSGTVALSCSGGPAHSTCMVSPSSLVLSSSASAKISVTLQTPQNVNHGTFPLTITATFAPDTHVATGSLTVK